MKLFELNFTEGYTREAVLHVNIRMAYKKEQAKACVEAWIKDMIQGEPILYKGDAQWKSANYRVVFDVENCTIVIDKKSSSYKIVEVTK